MSPAEPTVRREGTSLILPGLATAHSHAFQRALRGRTQRRATQAGSFWSWRGLMYGLAERLDPEAVFALSRLAYAELALAGVTAVGEFHYVHHQADGTAYDDRIALADAAVRAARDVGLRITLLRVLYERAGSGRSPEGAQRRFADADLDDAFGDVERLRDRFRDDSSVRVGLAPHSVRAVSRGGLERAARFAAKDELPLHAHVSEQRGEVRQCLEEHGLRPVELFAEAGAVGPRFVAVHATHLEPREAQLLGQAGAFACICRTTERDLGDGLADVATLVEHGARLCTGVDSHAISDPFEEARAIELDDRSRAEARTVAAEAPALLAAASSEGYAALGLDHAFDEDRVVLDAEDPSLALASPDALADAVVFGTTPRAVKRVEVAGRIVVDEGMLTASADDWPAIRRHAEAAMKRLGLM